MPLISSQNLHVEDWKKEDKQEAAHYDESGSGDSQSKPLPKTLGAN